MSLQHLYQEMLIDHGKTPRNFGKLAHPTCEKAGHNPLCGDKLIVFLLLQNEQVIDIKFEGTGCAISMASASLMTEVIKGKTKQEIENVFQHFHELVTTGKANEEILGKLMIFAGVAAFPIRVKCATLAWHTLKAALTNDSQTVTTE